ncbi:MAG: formate dehydrogenase subunit delta [Sphingobium sp.]|nr:formate dehydrogenase subunit delta [Sphingobium sp.]
MDIKHLTYMANQIARNVEARGHDVAVADTAIHIIKFWDPRMKATVLDGDRSGLSPIATEAMLKVEADVKAKAQAA